MKTGIIILNYNDLENTKEMLNQIKEYQCLDKIVVVDNCSTDHSYEQLKKYESKKITLLKAKKNKGYASGNNIGLKYLSEETTCELAIISNPDILVKESVIEELIDSFKRNPDISFLGPKVLEQGRISKGWKAPTLKSDLLSNINFFQRFSTKLLKYPDEHYKEEFAKVEAIHGCFFLARLKDFQKIGYFDPNTFLYYEENILAKKCEMKNLGTYVNTKVAVVHNLSQSVDKSLNKIKKYKRLKESQYYYETKYNKINFLGKFALRLTYYISLGIAYLTFWI